ncbi:hypothetical protein J4558_08785 [Leptolyngbya sp. 15MV]|nr:hypothetical protein J4558_08785 [Leptolyngbya sp. 15MV]
MATLLQFGGSLVAILVLAWLAHRLGLGEGSRIASDDEARALADEALCGFDARDVAIDREGAGALLRDAQGRVLLLRRHGARHAARLLDASTSVHIDGPRLTLATADRRFGSVTLDLGEEADLWAARLRGSGS